MDGAGPATLTRSGRCRSAQAPQLLPCARRCSRRSAGRALTLRRHDKPTRSSGSRPPAPGSRTSFSNSPVRRASPVVVPGRSPASAPNPWRIPAAQGLGALPQPLRPRAANTPQADPGRPRHPGVNRTARRPRSSGYFLGAGTTPHPFHEFKPSTTPRAIQADKLLTATYPWLLTYDDQEIIWANLYNAARCARFNIAHTAAIQHVGKETIVYGPTLTVPTGLEITPGVHATWIA